MNYDVTKTREDWKKLQLKHARYAHIKQDEIYISFRKKTTVNGTRMELEWCERYPNDDAFLPIRVRQGGKKPSSIVINEELIRYLKDILRLEYWPNNSSNNSNDVGATVETTIAYTKKGAFKQDKITINGKALGVPDIEALFNYETYKER